MSTKPKARTTRIARTPQTNHLEFAAPAAASMIDELVLANRKRRLDFRLQPELIYTWWRRCTVKVLLVTDGTLSFGEGDFGLSAFVRILKNDAPSRVRFDLTLAHINNVSDADMLISDTGITRRIKQFRFDNASHFTPGMYDQVWMFGISTSYPAVNGRGPGLAPAEVNAIHAHMEQQGGVFATGDHGFLGQALCGQLPRVRGMRHWADFPSSTNNINEVSMTGERRNDTNQIGHDAGSQFNDQSDDIPQPLDLRLYSTYAGFLRRARYPHPVLCGKAGRITVFPDHPHEGECRVPADVTLTFGGGDEYPLDAGGTRIVPEVIAWSRVPAGNNADGGKQPTVPHSFGAISAYDGHRAGVGRVICDSTWHHFVNVNLIGLAFDNPGDHPSKHDGFLSSPAGITALEKIKNYYTNIGVWISPPARHRCFNFFPWWELVFSDRVMEAALTSPEIPLEKIPTSTLLAIGIHARDAFGRRAGQCQTIEWILDWIPDIKLIEREWIDPWDPQIWVRLDRDDKAGKLPLPTLDPQPLVDVAIGAALVALRQQFSEPPEKLTARHDAEARKAIVAGATFGIKQAANQVTEFHKSFLKSLS